MVAVAWPGTRESMVTVVREVDVKQSVVGLPSESTVVRVGRRLVIVDVMITPEVIVASAVCPGGAVSS